MYDPYSNYMAIGSLDKVDKFLIHYLFPLAIANVTPATHLSISYSSIFLNANSSTFFLAKILCYMVYYLCVYITLSKSKMTCCT